MNKAKYIYNADENESIIAKSLYVNIICTVFGEDPVGSVLMTVVLQLNQFEYFCTILTGRKCSHIHCSK